MTPRDLINYVSTMPLPSSYPSVTLLTVLHFADPAGRCPKEVFIQQFRNYYIGRENAGLKPEKTESPLFDPQPVTDDQVWSLATGETLRDWKATGYLDFNEEFVRFHSGLWADLRAADIAQLRLTLIARLDQYYGTL
ncbi:MAG: hypothetical protein UZ15_CFX003000464 [Chloroflexi bacterium OLB15]|nr:MAG: hypothetical protein UZ15_CFX003000464 [Chloroflexi bacterium OLB15]